MLNLTFQTAKNSLLKSVCSPSLALLTACGGAINGRLGRKRPSTAARLAGYTATQFAAGAIVSGIFDGLTNLYRAIAKNKPAMPLKEMAGRAGFTGAAFAVIGLVFTAIGAAMARRKDQ